MSSLVLVRHAQASFMEADYDQLSSHGEEQARKLGDHWRAQNHSFDQVYTGPRKRHKQTAEIVGARLQAGGVAWPNPVELPGLDENHVDQLIIHHHEALAAEFPHVGELAASFHAAKNSTERGRRAQALFETVARLWMAEEVSLGVETWPTFRDRVHSALKEIVAHNGGGQRVAVVTSVGPIMAALQRTLDCPQEVALATGWRVWNCSITECVFSGERFTLDSFNTLPHLPDRSEWTYR